jgi:hypothetical protein
LAYFMRWCSFALERSGGERPSVMRQAPAASDVYRPKRPVLLAVDQQLGEGATIRVAPELSDPVSPVEVGQHQDVEQLGTGSWAERV